MDLHSSTATVGKLSRGHEPMATGVPDSYTALSAFERWFREGGDPVLMYHKLGPRPPRVRLKGLYVGTRLFRRQLVELRSEGFQTADLGDLTMPAVSGVRRIVLTFDDGFENVFREGLEPLREHGFRAIQFLVSGLMGGVNEWEQRQGEAVERLMDAVQVREWLSAGHTIGAHTRTHPRLTQIPLVDARAEIRDSKRILEDAFGVPIRHFCYPFGDWNPAVRDAVAEAGFESACTTVPGLNRPAGSPWELRRLTARHATRKWRQLGAWIHACAAAIRHP